jgi:acetoin:2,6-dichlorophenolindophenol oxidoreductase subunit alpha
LLATRPTQQHQDLEQEATSALSLSLYQKLYLCRSAEELIIRHYRADEMKTPMHMSMGQEAAAVGVCEALGPRDQIYGTYRSHAAFLARTGDADGLFAELFGKASGVMRGKGGSMHLADPGRGYMCSSAIVGTCIPVAVGAAYALSRRQPGAVACTFFGDGAVEEGAFWESINAACVMKLPVLFVCEDNGLAIHTSKQARQGFQSIAEVVARFNCSVYSGDGCDVERVHRMATDALTVPREGRGPAFIHVRCYRYLEHVGVEEDFTAGYRSREEYEAWRTQDCLLNQRRRLLALKMDGGRLAAVERGIDELLETALRRAQEAAFPGPDELEKGLFHEGA